MNNKFIAGLFIFNLLIMFTSATNIPYNDLTLNWKGNEKFINEKLPEFNSEKDIEFTFQYSNLDGNKILQRYFEEDEEQLINLGTRELIDEEGTFTTQWIPIDVKIGDKIVLSNDTFNVMSLLDKAYLKDFGNLEAIKLVHEETLDNKEDEFGEYRDIKLKESIWFEKNSGLKLKAFSEISDNYFSSVLQETYPQKTITQYELRENNLDNDKDGLSDLKELFTYKTNPLAKDTDNDLLEDSKEIEIGLDPNNKNTDGDLWIDGKDSNPLSKLIPLLYYIFGLILFGGLILGFIWFKYKKKRKDK